MGTSVHRKKERRLRRREAIRKTPDSIVDVLLSSIKQKVVVVSGTNNL